VFEQAKNHPELESVTQNLSIATFMYVPVNYQSKPGDHEALLNTLNEELLNELQHGGETFLSTAIVNGRYCLRSCIVNFRTSEKDIREIIEIVVREGEKIHRKHREK